MTLALLNLVGSSVVSIFLGLGLLLARAALVLLGCLLLPFLLKILLLECEDLLLLLDLKLSLFVLVLVVDQGRADLLCKLDVDLIILNEPGDGVTAVVDLAQED